MGDELEVEKIMEEREEVDARDQFGAGMVEFVILMVNDGLKMDFDLLDEGYFHNNYALAARFRIRECSSKKSSDGDCW